MPILNHDYLKNLDRAVYEEIYVENVYSVTEEEIKDKIVLDIGACIGYFSLRCVELGARQVIAVEPQPTNYSPALVEITQPYPNIKTINRAISDVDDKTVFIPSMHSMSTVNTKGYGDAVQTITLQTLLKDLPNEDLVLKIDCEGAEFDVFMTAEERDIRRFSVIYIEVHGDTHENPNYQDVELVHNKLRSFGFANVNNVRIFKHPEPNVKIPLNTFTEKWVRLDKTPKYSIVIPTARYFDKAFKPCIDAVLNYTTLEDKEIIVVPNGSPQETKDYLEQLIKQHPGKITYLWQDQPVGYVRAVNLGIDQSRGEFIILVDDDLFLLDQPKNFWIEILERSFKEDSTVAATAPDARTDYYHFQDYVKMVLHSNCAMYRANVLRSVGRFDEAYNPGYFSDSDVAMKIQKAGYKCAMATANRQPTVIHPGSGMMAIDFPAYHMSTVQTMNKKTDENLVFRNRKLLIERHGGPRKYSIIIPTYNHCEDLLKPCLESIRQYTDLDQAEVIVVANGCTDNTRNYVESLPDAFRLVWFDDPIGFTKATNEGIRRARGEYIVILNNDVELLAQAPNQWLTMLEVPFENNPKLGLTGALKLFDHDVQKDFLVFCCTMIKREVFDRIGLLDEVFSPGYGEDIDFTLRAVEAGYEFLEPCPTTNQHGENVSAHPTWHKGNKTFGTMPEYAAIVQRNREILKQRYKKITYSIVIPTYNHCEDLLKPCLESIKKYTNLDNVEIIVVANGCVDNTRVYVEGLGPPVKLVWSDAALGYTKATNLGIAVAQGQYVILLNNDVVLLEQPINHWINLLTQPFADTACGITGPVKFDWDCGGIRYDCMAFWLVMIKREVFDRIGILDEVYSPGMGEDGDFCIRAAQAGYTMVSVPNNVTGQFETGIKNFGFPIYHVGNGTFADDSNLKNSVIDRNNKLLADRWGIKNPAGPYRIDQNYRSRNTVAYFDDTQSKDEWQKEVYQYARKIAEENNYKLILDIGTGSGYKLVENFPTAEFSTIGIDLAPTCEYLRNTYLDKMWITFDLDNDPTVPEILLGLDFDLIICSDLIEHLITPTKLITFIRRLKFKKLIVSTPDRLLLEDTYKEFVGGPPMNPSHVREWTFSEFRSYLNAYFTLESQSYTNNHQPTMMAVCSSKLVTEPTSMLFDNSKITQGLIDAYNWCCTHRSDINEHVPTLRKFAKECRHITEFGTRDIVSTYGLLAAKPETLITYDLNIPQGIWIADRLAKENSVKFAFMHKNVLEVEIEPTDLLFIDTWHSYEQLKAELKLHSDKVNKYIIMHDTVAFGFKDETNGTVGPAAKQGLVPAIDEFLAVNCDWRLKEEYRNNNGLTVLERI